MMRVKKKEGRNDKDKGAAYYGQRNLIIARSFSEISPLNGPRCACTQFLRQFGSVRSVFYILHARKIKCTKDFRRVLLMLLLVKKKKKLKNM